VSRGRAIMTTDTMAKEAVRALAHRSQRDGEGCGDAVTGHGDDARCRQPMRRRSPDPATRSPRLVRRSLLSVDGCRSTNDTVLVLANGRAGPVDPRAYQRAHQVCGSLAE
jgi:N-acetylglutamate synthase/N-acetylornithine aminotransferase